MVIVGNSGNEFCVKELESVFWEYPQCGFVKCYEVAAA